MAAESQLRLRGSSLHIAMSAEGWIQTRPERSLLVLGPPRDAGKTSGVMIPLVLTAPGPCVSASSKDDVMRATILARSRFGKVWHYAPDGRTPTPPGCEPLRWSPIPASRDWTTAIITAQAIALATDLGAGMSDGEHWKQRAAALLSSLLYCAAHHGRSMRWVLGVVQKMDVREAHELLQGVPNPVPADTLEGIRRTPPKEQGSIFSTAQRAMAAYLVEGAMATTDDPNFDAVSFVRGEGPGGADYSADDEAWVRLDAMIGRGELERPRTDTVYITSSAENQRVVAPLVVGLLAQLRQATYEEFRLSQSGRRRLPVVFALDELYGLAPLPDLPSMIADCGSQGLLLAAALQDLSQARERWGNAADGFLTLFQEVVAFPGIRDSKTLEGLSQIIGDWDRPVQVASETYGKQAGRGWSVAYQHERVPILAPSDIARGHQGNPDLALCFQGSAWGWVFNTPYFRATPWPWVLVANMEHFARLDPDTADARVQLPTPELDRDGGRLLASLDGGHLYQRFTAARTRLEWLAGKYQEREVERQRHPLASGTLDERHGDIFGGQAYTSALIGTEELAEAMGANGAVPHRGEDGDGYVVASRESQVTVRLQPDLLETLTDHEWGRIGRLLGGAPQSVLVLSISGTAGDHLARNLVQSLARRWPFVAAIGRGAEGRLQYERIAPAAAGDDGGVAGAAASESFNPTSGGM
jgi:hypothetical protein